MYHSTMLPFPHAKRHRNASAQEFDFSAEQHRGSMVPMPYNHTRCLTVQRAQLNACTYFCSCTFSTSAPSFISAQSGPPAIPSQTCSAPAVQRSVPSLYRCEACCSRPFQRHSYDKVSEGVKRGREKNPWCILPHPLTYVCTCPCRYSRGLRARPIQAARIVVPAYLDPV
jgi:hypothetical protein